MSCKKTRKINMPRAFALTVVAAMTLALAFALVGCGGGSAPSSSSSAGSSASVSSSKNSAPKEPLDKYSWEELSKISDEIAQASGEDAAIEIAKGYGLTTADGKLDGTQTKTVNLTNGKTATVQVAGFAHDNKTAGGKAGITFIFKDSVGEHAMNSNDTKSGGWEASDMRSYLNSDGLALLPDDLKDVVVPVDKLTNNTGSSAENVSAVTVTSDSLWLYSIAELYGTLGDSFVNRIVRDSFRDVLNAEGTEYKLFRDMNVNGKEENGILSKDYDGSLEEWWSRSSNFQYTGSFIGVPDDGKLCSPGSDFGMDFSPKLYGVVPGFCI